MRQVMSVRGGKTYSKATFAVIAVFLAALVVGLGLFTPVGLTDAHAADTWIYIDGQSGSDTNDGSAGAPVQSWDKARELLGSNPGGIYVKGTVSASGEIYTNNCESQTVKWADGFTGALFSVPEGGQAIFHHIVVDGEDKAIDKAAVEPGANSKVYYLEKATFRKIGNYPGPWSPSSLDNFEGGCVSSIASGMEVVIDGATFENNKGKGIFYTPAVGFSLGVSKCTVTMKSGTVTGNSGYFYHNEAEAPAQNRLYIYNALIRNNDASNAPYPGRTAAAYICGGGQVNYRSLDGVAIYDNANYDIMQRDKYSGLNFETNEMLGGGNANWQGPETVDGGNGTYYAYKANPSDADKAKAVDAATSFIENNSHTLIDSNGTVYFGRTDSTVVPETPEITTPEEETPVEPTKVVIVAHKKVTGEGAPALAADQYTFELAGGPLAEAVTATNAADGTVAFAEVELTEAKTYAFTVKENAGDDQQITYDDGVRTVKVVTTDNNGTLVVDAEKSMMGDGSEVTVTENNGVFTVTLPDSKTFNNKYTKPAVETVDIKATKVWDDADNQDGKRPESVTINLLADGVQKESKIANEANNWQVTFAGLDVYAEDGTTEIAYTVEEDAVEGYEASYSADTLTITNSHTPETTKVEGAKTWSDNNNQDGKRPASITINLLADGKKIDSKTVKESDGWKWSFTDLPKYSNGAEIAYTITEERVAEYSAKVSGFNVTNTYTPGKTSVPVAKVWADGNDKDGLRPDSVVVKLLADGKDTGKTLTLNAGNEWQGSFDGLDAKKDGKDIKYTVDEASVPEGYTKSIDGTTITNTHTPSEDKPIKVDVVINKTDMNGTEVEGAVIVVADLDGNEVSSWTSKAGETMSVAVEPGEYILKETAAPTGFQKVETEIHFAVAADGTVTVVTTDVEPAGACEVVDGVLVLKDAAEKTTPVTSTVDVVINKTDMNGTEVEGAVIVVADLDGNEVSSWTSKAGETMSVAVEPGEYILKETAAPTGFQKVETEIHFAVAADGTVTVVTTDVEPAGACEVVDGVLVLKDAAEEAPSPTPKPNPTPDDVVTKTIKIKSDNGNTVVVTKDGKPVENGEWVSDGGEREFVFGPGTYTVTATDKDGNKKFDTIVVGEDGVVTVNGNVVNVDNPITVNPRKGSASPTKQTSSRAAASPTSSSRAAATAARTTATTSRSATTAKTADDMALPTLVFGAMAAAAFAAGAFSLRRRNSAK